MMKKQVTESAKKLLSKSLSQIVNEKYQAISVLTKYNLDYHNKGQSLLHQACDENNVPAEIVAEALETIYLDNTTQLDVNHIKLSELADYIKHTHHSYVKKEIPKMLSLLEEVASKYGTRYGELYEISELFVDLANEVTHHMHTEETILFARISEIERSGFEPVEFNSQSFSYIKLPIINMQIDHETVTNKMAEIKKLSNNFTAPDDSSTIFKMAYASLRAFYCDLQHHLHLESDILFKRALILEKELSLSRLN